MQKLAILFSSFISKDILKKYCRFWEQLLYYIYYIQKNKQFKVDRPGYQLTKAQENAFKTLVAAADEMTDRIEKAGRVESWEGSLQSQPKDPALARIDWLCLELYMTLLNYKLGNDKYKSVIISRLAILGFCNNRG